MVWKRLGLTGGSAIKFGGQDFDKWVDFVTGVADVDVWDINSNSGFRSGRLRNKSSTTAYSLIHTVGALAADRNVNWPALTAADIPTFNDFPATLQGKSISGLTNTLTNILDAAIGAHTSTKITIIDRTHLPPLAAYLDAAQTFTAVQKYDLALRVKPAAPPTTDAAYGQFLFDSNDSNKPKAKKPDGTLIDLTVPGSGGVRNLAANYLIYKSGSNYIAINSATNSSQFTDPSFQFVLDSCFTALASTGGKIVIGAGDFTLTSQFVGTVSKILLQGCGIGVTRILYNMGSTGAGFKITGSIGSAYTLTANSAKGAHTLTVASTTGIVAGDWIYLERDVNVDAGDTTRYDAEIHKVLSVTGTVVTLEDSTYEAYNTTDTAKFYKITFVNDFSISDMTLYDSRASVSSVTEQADTLFLFCKDLLIQNVKFENMVNASCGVQNCFNWHVNNIICEAPREKSSLDGIRYGLYSLSANTNGTIIGLKGQRCRHTFTTNTVSGQTYGAGRRRNTKLIGCQSFNADTAGFDTHESDIGISFNGCGATGGYPGNVTTDAKGFNTRSPTNFTDCWVEGSMAYGFVNFNNNDSVGTDTIPGADRTTYLNCRVNNTVQAGGVGKGIRLGGSSTGNRSSIIISNCQFYNVPDQVIQIEGGSNDIIIDNNIFHSCGSALSSSAGLIQITSTTTDILVQGNIFGAGTPPVSARPLYVTTSVDRCLFKDNDCNGLTNKMPTIPAISTDVTITDNLSLNPIGKITSPVNTTQNTIGNYGGTTSTVVASIDYTIVGGTGILFITGGTGVSITVKDGAGTTLESSVTSPITRTLPKGFKINFGAFSVAPTLIVGGY